jgi:hypothetical protein
MDAFSALLEARDPAQGRFRSYRLEAGIDLYVVWLVDVTSGRIGTRGRASATSQWMNPPLERWSTMACAAVRRPGSASA